MEPEWLRLKRVDSTNNWIIEYIKREANPVELAVVAEFQESGKGQGSNRWVSTEGENLLMSLLLFPEFLSAGHQFQLSRMASLAIVDFLATAGIHARIKWPNDILAGRGKIAGILIEHGVKGRNLVHSIIGIGVNINQEEFPAFRIPATSILLETGNRMIPEEAAKGLVSRLREWYQVIQKGDFKKLENAYRAKLYGLNQTITLGNRPDPSHASRLQEEEDLPSGKDLSAGKGSRSGKESRSGKDLHSREGPLTGILHDVSETGELLLEMPGGEIRRFSSGEVRMFGAS